MEFKMFSTSHKLKIINIVIKFIAINMMYNFVRPQFSSKMFFHNESMNSISRTIGALKFVARKYTTALWWPISRVAISQKTSVVTNAQTVRSAFVSVTYFLTSFDFAWFSFHKYSKAILV